MLMAPAMHGVIGGVAYSNFAYRSYVFNVSPNGQLHGPCLAPAIGRYCIIGVHSYGGPIATAGVYINGIAVTAVMNNLTDVQNFGVDWQGFFIAHVGTTDNANHNGGYDISLGGGGGESSISGSAAIWDVYMTSAVAHSKSSNSAYVPASLPVAGVTIPGPGFAILIGVAAYQNISAVNQGFTSHADNLSADVQKTTPFSGTVTVTFAGSEVESPGSVLIASFAGDGS
jgi:hypothetical protein